MWRGEYPSISLIPFFLLFTLRVWQAWLYSTMAYMQGNPATEWGSAAGCCALAGLWGWHIKKMATKAALSDIDVPDRTLPISRWMLMGAIWLPGLSLFSFPSIAYALSLSLPPENNSLGLNNAVLLQVFQEGIGLILFVISAYVVPPLARKLVARIARSSMNEAGIAQTAGEFMMLARLICYVLAPSVTVLLTTDECFAMWYVSLTLSCHL